MLEFSRVWLLIVAPAMAVVGAAAVNTVLLVILAIPLIGTFGEFH